jgi:hypothetical protein
MNVLSNLAMCLPLALLAHDPVLVAPERAVPSGRTPAGTVRSGATQSSSAILLDVGDLLVTEEAPCKSANPEGKCAAPSGAKETSEQKKARATSTFADMLKRWMKPAFAPDQDRVEAVAPGQLALVASAEKLAWAGRFCELQRKTKGLVYVETHILDIPKGTLEALGVEGPTKAFDKTADVEALLAGLKDRPGTNLLSAPRLMIFPRSRASMSVGEPVSYVADWRMEVVEPGPQYIGVPTIETVFDGILIETCAVPIDENVFGLEMKFTNSKVQRPIPTRKTRIGSGEGKEVEVALPEVHKVGLDSRMTLADGASVLFQMLSSEEGRMVAVAVTLRHVDADAQKQLLPDDRSIGAEPR